MRKNLTELIWQKTKQLWHFSQPISAIQGSSYNSIVITTLEKEKKKKKNYREERSECQRERRQKQILSKVVNLVLLLNLSIPSDSWILLFFSENNRFTKIPSTAKGVKVCVVSSQWCSDHASVKGLGRLVIKLKCSHFLFWPRWDINGPIKERHAGVVRVRDKEVTARHTEASDFIGWMPFCQRELTVRDVRGSS